MPRAGRDAAFHRTRACVPRFNPRAPYGARRSPARWSSSKSLFQSTRPAWGTTPGASGQPADGAVSIHAPRTGRDQRRLYDVAGGLRFNPRAPCGARPAPFANLLAFRVAFQSTRPVRGATPLWRRWLADYHSFNPRAPCGARLSRLKLDSWSSWFQSTRPAWGATSIRPKPQRNFLVSIHAPRTGRDFQTQCLSAKLNTVAVRYFDLTAFVFNRR